MAGGAPPVCAGGAVWDGLPALCTGAVPGLEVLLRVFVVPAVVRLPSRTRTFTNCNGRLANASEEQLCTVGVAPVNVMRNFTLRHASASNWPVLKGCLPLSPGEVNV